MSKARTMSNLLTSSGDVITTALDNVGAAGALMDSEVTNLAQVKAFDSSDYATAAQGTLATNALPKAGGTVTGNILHNDNVKALFGTGSDLEIYHDGSNSYFAGNPSANNTVVVKPGGTGSVLITNSSGDNIITQQGDVAMLHYNGSTKLATNASGVTVTGEVAATSLDISGDVDVDGILEADAITLNGTALGSLYSPIAGGSGIVTTGAINSGSITSGFGTINNGSSTITTTGAVATGALTTTGDITLSGELNMSASSNNYIDFADALHIRAAGSSPAYEDSIYCVKDAGVSVMYNGSAKIATSATGATVTGALTVNGGTSSNIYMQDTDETTRRIHCNTNNIGFLTSAGGWGAYCTNTGNWIAAGNVTAFSDLRIKDNLEVIPDALSKVEQLNGYTYTRTDLEDKEEKHTGIIAQEVLKVLPEAVTLGKTPEDTMSVAYGNMVGLLIEAVKELSDKVKELEENQNGFTK